MPLAFIDEVKYTISSSIPTSASIISKIIPIIYDEKSNASDLANIFEHDPMTTPKSSQMLARLVNLGDYMCRKAEIGNPGDEVNPKPSKAILATLGSTSQKINAKFDEIFQEFLEFKNDIEGFFAGLN